PLSCASWRPPPDLRPSPTRRSSDLPAASGGAVRPRPGGGAAGGGDDRCPRPRRPVRHLRSDVPGGGGGRGDGRPAAPGEGRGRRDRKSTRLNSSHVKISYAVFCLKK